MDRVFSTLRSFGIEVEIGKEVSKNQIVELVKNNSHKPTRNSFYHPSINNNHWDVKNDASCGAKFIKNMNEGGYEITSFKGSGINDLIHISDVVGKLKQLKVKVNENCGLHIHVDIKDFDLNNMGCLINNWLVIENYLFDAVTPRRKNNKYCIRLCSMKNDSKVFKSAFDYWNYYRPRSTSLSSAERRMAINLVNYKKAITLKNFKRKTVEFRFPESTLCSKNIKNWARILINFVENVKRTNCIYDENSFCDISNFLTILGLHDPDKKIKFSKGLAESRNWIVKKMLRHSGNPKTKDEIHKYKLLNG